MPRRGTCSAGRPPRSRRRRRRRAPTTRAARGAVADLGQQSGVPVVLDDDRDRARVGEDPLDLLRGAGLVDRDRDAAGVPDRVVQDGPLVARARHQADPVAGFELAEDGADRGSRAGDLGPTVDQPTRAASPNSAAIESAVRTVSMGPPPPFSFIVEQRSGKVKRGLVKIRWPVLSVA